MTNFITFIRDEDGAVTLDWVALSAGIVLLAIGIITAVDDNVENLVQGIESNLEEANKTSITSSD